MKKFSIIIPTRNEGEGIERIIRSVMRYSDDIIVVDGHSKDKTKEIAHKLGAKFYLDHGLGKGDAMKVGMQKAKYDILIYFDADGSHDEKDISKIASLLLSKKADFVMGSRRTGGSFDVSMSFQGIIRSAGCDLLVMLINHKFQTKLTDVLYSFRGTRKDIFRSLQLKDNGFGIEQEMVVSCLKKGFLVSEIPSREKARGWGESKLSTISGVKFLWNILLEYIK
ncbi:glycosyltransferase family 2 protein [Candidatus Gottesmanbacteria bacterium]|nr:glycosyltransferase family 2 protein [Candidatus Gottesmanbacteria bacterium]